MKDCARSAIQTSDLRKSPYKGTRTYPLAYNPPAPSSKQSTALPIQTQQRFINAARAAAEARCPLNTMLTIRWNSLFSSNDVNHLRTATNTIPHRIDRIVEGIRHWLGNRSIASFYIWVRESVKNEGEHFHFAFHLPPKYRREFSSYIAKLTGEPQRRTTSKRSNASEGEFACGEASSWHLAKDINPDRNGFFLAAYLGKAEPSEVILRGVLQANSKKPVRGKSFGGNQPDGKYDSEQGIIKGTETRSKRFFISKQLQRLQRYTPE